MSTITKPKKTRELTESEMIYQEVVAREKLALDRYVAELTLDRLIKSDEKPKISKKGA